MQYQCTNSFTDIITFIFFYDIMPFQRINIKYNIKWPIIIVILLLLWKVAASTNVGGADRDRRFPLFREERQNGGSR